MLHNKCLQMLANAVIPPHNARTGGSGGGPIIPLWATIGERTRVGMALTGRQTVSTSLSRHSRCCVGVWLHRGECTLARPMGEHMCWLCIRLSQILCALVFLSCVF